MTKKPIKGTHVRKLNKGCCVIFLPVCFLIVIHPVFPPFNYEFQFVQFQFQLGKCRGVIQGAFWYFWKVSKWLKNQ